MMVTRKKICKSQSSYFALVSFIKILFLIKFLIFPSPLEKVLTKEKTIERTVEFRITPTSKYSLSILIHFLHSLYHM